jgi:S-adenosylmethionine:tRNA-ribosyltransferase-isomerase (queuine synthetase)
MQKEISHTDKHLKGQVIIHVGTNSLRERESPAACAEEIAELAKSNNC